MSDEEKLSMREKARNMFHFGYDNYMTHAFPDDELNPIFCKGRGPDHENPGNININDVLGDYQLTLIDSLDTLAVMGNVTEFRRAVELVMEYLSFDRTNTVQVFEANIRIVGALLSAHLILTDPGQPFGNMRLEKYNDELLQLAHDLANRLLPAFENTGTGIPHPRVNLRLGVPADSVNETCLAGAGTLLLEFGALSRLLGDPTYELSAKRAIRSLWRYRSNVTGLFGNVINIHSGHWTGEMSGIGAGLDSFYEYLLKGYVVFGDREYLDMFRDAMESIRFYLKRGRSSCRNGLGYPPMYVNVNMKTGDLANNWVDALQAAWPAVLVLNGQVDEAICIHAYFYAIWRKYGVLPERFNWYLKAPDVKFYPLRPELVESTYILYKATRHPFYLHVGKTILNSLETHTKVKCGYATVHDVTNKKLLEDRMESFFLSETCKYLYLLFDERNPVNTRQEDFIFSTEGHLFPIRRLQKKEGPSHRKVGRRKAPPLAPFLANHSRCENIRWKALPRTEAPLSVSSLEQIDSLVGL